MQVDEASLRKNTTSSILTSSKDDLDTTAKLQTQNAQTQDAPRIESVLCESYYTHKIPQGALTFEMLYDWIRRVFKDGLFDGHCVIVSLVYINRLTSWKKIPVTGDSWKPLVIGSLIVAQKWLDDVSLINSDFPLLYPELTARQINHLERSIYRLLEFKIDVSREVHAHYYFTLRALFDIYEAPPSSSTVASDHSTLLYAARKLRFRKSIYATTLEDLIVPSKILSFARSSQCLYSI